MNMPGLPERDKTVARLFLAIFVDPHGGPAGQLDGYRMAADIYGQVLETLSQEDPEDTLHRAVAQRSLGSVLPILAPELEHLQITGDGEEGAAGP